MTHPDLVVAYAGAEYVFQAHGRFYLLRVGVADEEVAGLLRRHGVREASFITADNPRSTPRGVVFNKFARRRLWNALKRSPSVVALFPGEGRDPGGNWPGEASFMVLGIGVREAKRLGHRFGQNAVLSINESGLVQLRLIARSRPPRP